MEKIIERINELLKKKSKIGNADSLEAANLIYQLYCSNKDCEILVNYLYDFYYKISGIFINKYYFQVSEGEKTEIIQSFLKSKKFYENQSGASLFRGFSILTEIISKDIKDTNIITIINSLAKIAEKNNIFNQTSCETLLNFLNTTNGKFFDLDLASLSNYEIKRLFRYISTAISDISIITYSNKIQAWSDKYSFTFIKKNDVANVSQIELKDTASHKIEKIVEIPTQNTMSTTNTVKSVEIESAKEILKILQSTNQEAQKLFDNIFSKNNTIQNIQENLNIKEKEMNLLKVEIENKNIALMSLRGELNKVKVELADREMKISDITERLKASFNADDISKKQELITLKNDIATAVKLQYEDFNEHKNESCNEDNYEALKVTLNQVFRTLKRYGIEL